MINNNLKKLIELNFHLILLLSIFIILITYKSSFAAKKHVIKLSEYRQNNDFNEIIKKSKKFTKTVKTKPLPKPTRGGNVLLWHETTSDIEPVLLESLDEAISSFDVIFASTLSLRILINSTRHRFINWVLTLSDK